MIARQKDEEEYSGIPYVVKTDKQLKRKRRKQFKDTCNTIAIGWMLFLAFAVPMMIPNSELATMSGLMIMGAATLQVLGWQRMDKLNKTYTRKNPDGRTYHVPIGISEEFKTLAHGLNGAYYGDFINKLGVLEELKLDMELVEKLAKVPHNRLVAFLRTQ